MATSKNTVADAFLQIEQQITSNEMPDEQYFISQDYEKLLDRRDGDVFSSPWTDSYNLSTKLYEQSVTDQAQKERLDKIREHIFKRIYKITEVSDLASYVSDDFDLILKTLLSEREDEWVNALWLEYKDGNVPSGQLIPASGNLKDLILS